jgi:hypothetical protein
LLIDGPMHAADRSAAAATSVPQGVQPIHEIPEGVACVRDQVAYNAPIDGRYQAFLAAIYHDDEVARQLVTANQLIGGSNGEVGIYVPPGMQIVIPAMCYSKEGASAVSLQAGGTPSSGGSDTADTVTGWLVFAAILFIGALLVKWLR